MDEETPFTKAQYDSLTAEEKHVIDAVGTHLTGWTEEGRGEITDENLSETFNLLKETSGCVPPEEIGDSLEASIRKKFAAVYYPAVELAEEELKSKGHKPYKDFNFHMIIDPDHEDTTNIAIVDFHKPVCYLHDCCKAWHFYFTTLGELAEAVIAARNQIVHVFLTYGHKVPEDSRLP